VILPDVNVLVYAHRQDASDHVSYRRWLEKVVRSEAAFGLSDLVLSSFIRVVTHPAIFTHPTDIGTAMYSAERLRDQPNSVMIEPGPRHWGIFSKLCKKVGAKGSLVPDAYLAALAIESGSEWITTDRDFSRFPSLRWRHPLQPA
jgi:hypothetical protein